MRSFTDSRGRVWNIDVTVATIKRVRIATDYVLPTMFDDKLGAMQKLVGNYELIVDILWAMVEPDAREFRVINPETHEERIGLSAEEFGSAMGGDSLYQATEALVRATADFFTSRDQRDAANKLLDLIMQTSEKATSLAGQKLTTAIGELDANQLAQNCLDYAIAGQQ